MTYLLRVGLLGGFLSIFALMPIAAHAAQFLTEEQPSVPAGQTISDDLYMAGGSALSAGTIRGDLVIAGGNVLVNGPVDADLIAAGGTVMLLGTIGDDVRAAGGNVVVQGAVNGDVIVGGGQITLSGPRIGGDVAAGGGTITISAPVGGSIRIGGGEVRIDAPVGGNVDIEAGKVTLGPRAVIDGNLTYRAPEEATLEEGASVHGETSFEMREDRPEKAWVSGILTAWVIAKFLMMLAGALLIGLLLHRFSREVVATAATQPLLEIGRGVVVFIVLPILSVIFLVTIIGIPFGVMGLLSFAVLCIFAHLVSAVVTGSIVHKWIWKPAGYEVNWKTILLGVAVLFVLSLIPILGSLAKFAILLLTIGAIVNIKWSVLKEWR